MIGRRRESGSAWYGQLVGSIAAGLSKRPKITVETLILLVALYFLMATNAAFWNALAATGVLEGSRGWSIVAALAVAIVGSHAAMLSLLLNRWIAKPVLTILVLLTACVAYFADSYSVTWIRA